MVNPIVKSEVEAGYRTDYYANGTRHVTRPDGSSKTYHPNGSRTETPPPPGPGEVPYEKRPWPVGPSVQNDNSIHVYHPDREEITNVDGSVDIRYRDGRVVSHPAPPTMGPTPHGMPRVHTVTGTDGSVLQIHPNGARTYTYRPGMTPEPLDANITGPLHRPQVPPIVQRDPDGTVRQHDLDGTQHIHDDDGTETIIPPQPLDPATVDRIREDIKAKGQRPFTVARPGQPEMIVDTTGQIDIVKDDGTQVRMPAPPPHVFGDPSVDHRTNDVRIDRDGNIIRSVDHVSADGRNVHLGTGTLISRPDGSHVFELPDGSILFTAPDGTQGTIPKGGAIPPVVVPGTPPVPTAPPMPPSAPEPPSGCSKPAIAAIGTILVLIGVGVVTGIALDEDSSEDTVLKAADAAVNDQCDQEALGSAVDPGAPVLIAAQECGTDGTTTTTEDETTTTTEDETSNGGTDAQVFVGQLGGLGSADVRANEVRIERGSSGDVFELHVQLFADLDIGLFSSCATLCPEPDPEGGDPLCVFIDVGPTAPLTAPATVDLTIGAIDRECDGSRPDSAESIEADLSYAVGDNGVTGALVVDGNELPFTASPA